MNAGQCIPPSVLTAPVAISMSDSGNLKLNVGQGSYQHPSLADKSNAWKPSLGVARPHEPDQTITLSDQPEGIGGCIAQPSDEIPLQIKAITCHRRVRRVFVIEREKKERERMSLLLITITFLNPPNPPAGAG